MKKITILIAALILSITTFSQVRKYPNCKNIREYYKESVTTKGTVSIKFTDDDGTNLDNIDYVSYQYGHIYPLTLPTFSFFDNEENPCFSFKAMDENGYNIECIIVKYSEIDIGFLIYYSKNLNYYFRIKDLTKFRY